MMVVKTQCDGSDTVSLWIGAENVARFFPERVGSIELQVGGLRIQFPLTESFWRDQPVLRDARLGEWINFSIFHKATSRASAQLELIPLGKNLYQLRPLEVRLPPQRAEEALLHAVQAAG